MTYIKKNVFQFETDYEIPIKSQVWIIKDEIPDNNCKISTLKDFKPFHLILTDAFDYEDIQVIKMDNNYETKEYFRDCSSDNSDDGMIFKEKFKTFLKTDAEVGINNPFVMFPQTQVQWECSQCTLLNDSHCQRCVACSKSKDEPGQKLKKQVLNRQFSASLDNLKRYNGAKEYLRERSSDDSD